MSLVSVARALEKHLGAENYTFGSQWDCELLSLIFDLYEHVLKLKSGASPVVYLTKVKEELSKLESEVEILHSRAREKPKYCPVR